MTLRRIVPSSPPARAAERGIRLLPASSDMRRSARPRSPTRPGIPPARASYPASTSHPTENACHPPCRPRRISIYSSVTLTVTDLSTVSRDITGGAKGIRTPDLLVANAERAPATAVASRTFFARPLRDAAGQRLGGAHGVHESRRVRRSADPFHAIRIRAARRGRSPWPARPQRSDSVRSMSHPLSPDLSLSVLFLLT